ncbi:uncharacterized protein METZ01_LOCUS251469 [marine metagenome]|uniref:Uncharacterized protein n=1 Tax=marine metagenome TaxID=408172 RepID=A0A382IGY1_9ZZZZ
MVKTVTGCDHRKHTKAIISNVKLRVFNKILPSCEKQNMILA